MAIEPVTIGQPRVERDAQLAVASIKRCIGRRSHVMTMEGRSAPWRARKESISRAICRLRALTDAAASAGSDSGKQAHACS